MARTNKNPHKKAAKSNKTAPKQADKPTNIPQLVRSKPDTSNFVQQPAEQNQTIEPPVDSSVVQPVPNPDTGNPSVPHTESPGPEPSPTPTAPLTQPPLSTSSNVTETVTTARRTSSASPPIEKQRNPRRIRLLFGGVALLSLLIAAGTWVFGDDTAKLSAENQQLVSRVAARAVVPADETPAITTVVDEKQVDQEFLRNAKKGDKVLLYFQAGRAIVYRPSADLVVNMGPLETPKPKVFVRNGTSSDDSPKQAVDRLAGSSEFLLSSQDQSSKKTYTQTTVVDLTGTRPDVASRLARLLNATVSKLPDGESRPDADLLVITGSDL